ncbi:carbohydrate kinase [Aureococcus anophagefferens]|nr:carbohydrate kinase [Aureococcus anophagefferens]
MALLPLLGLLATSATALRGPARRLHARRAPSMALDIRDSVDLLFVGGKGGVGKTSVSAAIGFEWSARGARTLLVEVPALHTGSELGGVFGLKWEPRLRGRRRGGADGIFERGETRRLRGKGGVGKTTVSSALAVALADRGFDTLVISTDPAHSLGDCLAVDLSGGAVVEVDADAAAREAAALLKEGLGEKLRSLGDAGAAAADLADALETSPPGLDELVSLLKVLELIRSKQYDRIVLDTAPTGHTLRLLALPELMDDFAERSMNARDRAGKECEIPNFKRSYLSRFPLARDRLKRNPVVAAALAGAGFSGGGGESGGRDAVRDVQDDAFAMDAILHDEASCEFLAVAAPTDLSLTETANLLDSSTRRASPAAPSGFAATCTHHAERLAPLAARVAVVGSTNNDLICSGPRLPLAGETIAHETFATCFGGKGANQAVQAARAGAAVDFVGKVGADDFGAAMRTNFDDCGVGRAHVTTAGPGVSTGVALITVGAAERTNTIVIVPGANGALSPADVAAAADAFSDADVLLTQMEVPPETTLAALEAFRAAQPGGLSVLNVAPVPAAGVPDALLGACDVVCPNEVELALLVGCAPIESVRDAVEAARALLRRGRDARRVLATRLAGSLLVGDRQSVFVPALAGVDAVDTTGAGDSFLGAFGAFVAAGDGVAAMAKASRVAALAVQGRGSQPSFPALADVALSDAPAVDEPDVHAGPDADWALEADGTLAPLPAGI